MLKVLSVWSLNEGLPQADHMHRISTEKLKLLMLEKTIEEAAGLYLKALVDQESSSAEMPGNLAATHPRR